jgi:uracil-DNA glycosylase
MEDLYRQGLNLVVEMLRGLKHRAQPDLHADIATLERIIRLPEAVKESSRHRRIDEPAIPQDFEGPVPERPEHRDVSEPVPADEARMQPQEPPNPGELEQAIDELRTQVLACTKCANLVAFRHTVVFGVGNPKAELMFVGEAPGADEDMQGEPFVGRAGELLTKIIQTMGFQRSEVYIANVLKCRPDIPPGSPNRQPTETEMETCLPYLRRQIELIEPKVIVALGTTAMRGLFGTVEPMRELRGRWHEFNSIPVMATFHPSYLLRNQPLSVKRKTWEDMLQVLERLGRPITERQKNYFLAR